MEKLRFKKKSRRSLEKRGFYLTIAICMLAIGFISYSTIGAGGAMKNTKENEASDNVSPARDVRQNVSGIPYPESSGISEETSYFSSQEIKYPKSSYVPYESELSAADTEYEASVGSSPEVSGEVQKSAFFVLPCGGKIIKNCDLKNLQYSETYKDWRLHTGIDFAAAKGSFVTSSGSGTVTKVYADELYGTVVEIDHGGDITALYCGLNKKPSVEAGQTVKPGDILGTITAIPCESVEQTHLHFSVKIKNQYVNPLDLIKK